MALANVLGFNSNDAFDRSLKCAKTDNEIDDFCPKMNIENKIENILVSEISRIGRKVVSVLQFIEQCSEYKNNASLF